MFEAFSLHVPAGISLDIQTLRFFADVIPHMVWVAEAGGHLLYANKQWYAYTGLTFTNAEEMLQAWLSTYHPEDRAKLQYAWQDALALGVNMQGEARLRRHDGVYRWHLIRATAQRDAGGKVWLWVGTCTDIDEQKRVEQILKASEENFRVLAETIPQLVWSDSTDGSLIYCNQRYLTYTQATLAEMQDSGWHNFLHPDDLERVLSFVGHSLETGEVFEVEHRFQEGKTGRYRWFLTRGTPVRDESGQIIKWVGTSTDIDDLKRVEEALRASEARLRHLIDANIIGVSITDLEGTIHEANQAFLSLVGYTQQDLKAGRIRWPTMTPPEYRERDALALKNLLRTGAFPVYEKEYSRKDGQRVPVAIAGALFHWKDSLPCWITLTMDMTALKEVERQKDFFLAMTSHELKTPLTTLKGTLQLAQRRVKHLTTKPEALSPEMHTLIDNLSERLAVAIRQVDVQTRMINDLLDMSRITTNTLKLEMKPCDLAAIVRETVEDLRAIDPARSLLLTLPEHYIVTVLADQSRISQVLKNYVTNALRYAPADQPIQIGLSMQGQLARVWVQDKGPGLSEEAQQRIWNLFQQSEEVRAQKGTGRGLGLGLYLCRTLVTQHQGQVGVESTPGEGSTFWFMLPLVQ